MDYSQSHRHAHLNSALGRTCRSISQGGGNKRICSCAVKQLLMFLLVQWDYRRFYASVFKQDIKFVTQEKNKDLGWGLLIKSRHYGIWKQARNWISPSCEIVWNSHTHVFIAFFQLLHHLVSTVSLLVVQQARSTHFLTPESFVLFI